MTAYEQGYADAQQGNYNNPYSPTSEQFNEYNKGHYDGSN